MSLIGDYCLYKEVSLADRSSDFRPIIETMRAPVIAAPMFLVSGPDLTASACGAGVIGAIPAHNAASIDELDRWLAEIPRRAAEYARRRGGAAAPYALNIVAYRTNRRLSEELALARERRAPIVIVSVGDPGPLTDGLRGAGALVLADVASMRHARRAVEAGVDGLVLLTAGAGGQTGRLNPFAFTAGVRRFYEGPIAVAGGVTNGRQVRALQLMGADLAYIGTPFVAARESMAPLRSKMPLSPPAPTTLSSPGR